MFQGPNYQIYHIRILTICMLGNLYVFYQRVILILNILFNKKIEGIQSVKQFGPMSGLTFC